LVGRFFLHPVDTVKSRLQSHDVRFKTIGSVFRAAAQTEGISGLYRGFTAILMGGIPGTCIYLTAYESLKVRLTSDGRFSPFAVYLSSGLIAEAMCCVLYVPVDVVKERLQVQTAASSYRYTGSLNALSTILRTEGVRGLYLGYASTIMSYGPFSALYFLIYEKVTTPVYI
jgi:Mitochondrial carrier protein